MNTDVRHVMMLAMFVVSVSHYKLLEKNTGLVRFIEEDAIRLIRSVQDILRAIDAKIATPHGLVITGERAAACLLFFVASFHALKF